ncbi:MAG TPA: hypothetical protein PL094_00405 [Acinetobacter johnsonii]|nr:hypothetical protein [Acinetobacter johnsonii]
MSLIEQLGGYEAAKAEYDDPMYEDGELYTIKATGARFFKHNLAEELLEYRRQHNIFEVGDLVVSRCSDRETRIFKYETTIGKNIVVKCKRGKGYCYPKKWFSHANDEEIEAGKRLEVL